MAPPPPAPQAIWYACSSNSPHFQEQGLWGLCIEMTLLSLDTVGLGREWGRAWAFREMACTPELTSHREKRHTNTALHDRGLHHPSSPTSHPFPTDLLLLMTLFYSLRSRPYLAQGLPSCCFACLESPFSVRLPGWLPVYIQFSA